MFVHVMDFLSNPFLIDTSWQLFCIPLSLVSDHHVKKRQETFFQGTFSWLLWFSQGKSQLKDSVLTQKVIWSKDLGALALASASQNGFQVLK